MKYKKVVGFYIWVSRSITLDSVVRGTKCRCVHLVQKALQKAEGDQLLSLAFRNMGLFPDL